MRTNYTQNMRSDQNLGLASALFWIGHYQLLTGEDNAHKITR